MTLFVLLLSVTFSTAQETDRCSLKSLRSIIQERSLGDYSGYSEKYVHRCGDRVSIGLIKIYDQKQLADSKTLKLVLELVKESFGQPESIISEDDASPSVTFLLLENLNNRLKDKNAKAEIERVKGFITEQLRVHSVKGQH